MKIAILTIFPDMFQSLLSTSILGRARAEGLLTVEPVDIRPYSAMKHKNTDDYPFGGGAGMVMTPQPIVDAVRDMRARGFAGPCLYMSPRGKPLTQAMVCELAAQDGLVLLCGHYEGVDQRALDTVVDGEISLGDFVLTGGELAAMAVVDAVARLVPGVLGSSDSAEDESFSEGLLEYPQYTRPREFEGQTVPEVLLSGDHAKINAWRRKQALAETLRRRPDLFATAPMTEKERAETIRTVAAQQAEATALQPQGAQGVANADTPEVAHPAAPAAAEAVAPVAAKAKRAATKATHPAAHAVAEAVAPVAAKAKRAATKATHPAAPAVAEAVAPIAAKAKRAATKATQPAAHAVAEADAPVAAKAKRAATKATQPAAPAAAEAVAPVAAKPRRAKAAKA